MSDLTNYIDSEINEILQTMKHSEQCALTNIGAYGYHEVTPSDRAVYDSLESYVNIRAERLHPGYLKQIILDITDDIMHGLIDSLI